MIELLAPAGSIDGLKAAVLAGANAVYLGLGELNARVKSDDFTIDNLSEWVDYCHFLGVRVHVTLNTEIYQDELDRMRRLVDAIYLSGADAIISCDLSVLEYSKTKYPSLQIHVSTQSGVRTDKGAAFFKQLGADRIVCARECSLNEISGIVKILPTECFVHGALCVAFSGGCLMSCHIGGNSGNRGRCRQPCRKLYTAKDLSGNILKKGYLLSAKDISLDKHLSELVDLGVCSLKIEGRLKSPEYVYAVTKYYRELLDGYKIDKKDVLTVFNRGSFCEAYLDGNKVIYTKSGSHIGYPIGKVVALKTIKGFNYAVIDQEVSKGDGLKILRKGLEVGGSDVTSVQKVKDGYLIPVSQGVKVGDEVRLTKKAEFSAFLNGNEAKQKVDFELILGEMIILKATCLNKSVEIADDYLIETEKTLSDQTYVDSLSKTGQTKFTVKSILIWGSGYMPKSQINAMRNKVLRELEAKILLEYKPTRSKNVFDPKIAFKAKIDTDIVEIDDPNQAKQENVTIVFKPKELDSQKTLKDLERLKNNYNSVYIRYPLLIDFSEEKKIIDICKKTKVGIYADSYSAIQSARENDIDYIAGMGLNITNDRAMALLADAKAYVGAAEIISTPLPQTHTYTFGRLPLMKFEHCPTATVYDCNCATCNHRGETLKYNDGFADFPLIAVTTGGRCFYTLYSDKAYDIDLPSGYLRYVSLCDIADAAKLQTIGGRPQ